MVLLNVSHHGEETIHCFAIHLHKDEKRFVILMKAFRLLYELQPLDSSKWFD